ncbi:MAG: biotin/lipoyl-binding protein, partial [bacterium]|nr:biotin/lipoyl-binding protein [bacterium]
MRRKIIVSIILIVVLLTGGIGISAGLVLTRPSPPRRDTDRPSLVVQTLVVNPQTVVETIVGYGTAWADRYARLSAQVSGEIVELDDWVRPGAAVQPGQVLLRIDEADYRSRLEGATSRLAAQRARLAELDAEEGNINRLIAIAAKERDIAQSEFDRVEALFEGGESHPREYDEYHRALQRARSALQVHENRKTRLPSQRTQLEAGCGDRESDVALAQLNLDRCRITAPFAGRIDQVGVELGERIQVGQELLALLNPELIEVPIEL